MLPGKIDMMKSTATIGERTLTEGDEVSFFGTRGRFRFKYATYTYSGDLKNLSVYGGSIPKHGRRQWRTFAPENLKTIHRIKRMK